jgi:hypothetical protein
MRFDPDRLDVVLLRSCGDQHGRAGPAIPSSSGAQSTSSVTAQSRNECGQIALPKACRVTTPLEVSSAGVEVLRATAKEASATSGRSFSADLVPEGIILRWLEDLGDVTPEPSSLIRRLSRV